MVSITVEVQDNIEERRFTIKTTGSPSPFSLSLEEGALYVLVSCPRYSWQVSLAAEGDGNCLHKRHHVACSLALKFFNLSLSLSLLSLSGLIF